VTRAQEIVQFWFEDATTNPQSRAERTKVWFSLGREDQQRFDTQIRESFGSDVDQALRGDLDGWGKDAHGRLALVLLLDQFTRNIFRGSAQAFAGDASALQLVLDGCRTGADRLLHPVERLFFYLPLEHAEDAAMQNKSVDAFTALATGSSGDLRTFFKDMLPYAQQHREIVTRFGRFPHRNAALGRQSTPAEREYLAGNAPNFGQTSN